MLHFSKVFMACSLFLIMICKFPAAAQQFIHEAFITKISSMIALEAIEQTSFDIYVMDFQLPDGGGIEHRGAGTIAGECSSNHSYLRL